MNFLLSLLFLLSAGDVRTGLDVLARDGFRPLQGKRVGLVTNQSAVDAEGRPILEVFAAGKGFTLAALFSPEHGFRGTEDVENVEGGRDGKTGLPIHSLYGKTRKPTAEMLRGVDVLVFDIQDVGTRYYTYITTMALVMEAARENGKRVVVLDRPNPIGGDRVEGPVLDKDLCGSFIGWFPLPLRHGMTVGELARLFNGEFKIGCDLEVVKLEGWKRSMLLDETGLPWVNPSPNMRSLEAALSYPGLGALEATNLSVGRGTDLPFLVYGAPGVDSRRLCDRLNGAGLGGVRFDPASFTPSAGSGYPHAGRECRGFRVRITDRAAYRPVTAALHALDALLRLHPKDFSVGDACRRLGRASIEDDLRAGKSPGEIERAWQKELELFKKKSAGFFLYDR